MNYKFNNEPSNIFQVLWYCHFEMWRDIFHQMTAYCVQLGLPTVCKYLYTVMLYIYVSFWLLVNESHD